MPDIREAPYVLTVYLSSISFKLIVGGNKMSKSPLPTSSLAQATADTFKEVMIIFRRRKNESSRVTRNLNF